MKFFNHVFPVRVLDKMRFNVVLQDEILLKLEKIN